MNIPGEDVLSTSWHRVRDAGSAVGELATVGATGMLAVLPKVKDLMATGAGLAVARRGAKVAIATVRRNPVAVIGGAVALAGIGLAYSTYKKRKAAVEAASDGNGAAKPKRLTAANRRQAASTGAERKTARATRQRKPRGDAE
jgi:hypothetical protein